MIPASHSPTPGSDQLPVEVRATLTLLRSRAWGVATGLLFGVGLFAATLILVIMDGPNKGAHLGLLAVFLPGYSVTGVGCVVGLIYGFVIGYATGWLTARVYNVFVRPV